jgi:hypothetical protein
VFVPSMRLRLHAHLVMTTIMYVVGNSNNFHDF